MLVTALLPLVTLLATSIAAAPLSESDSVRASQAACNRYQRIKVWRNKHRPNGTASASPPPVVPSSSAAEIVAPSSSAITTVGNNLIVAPTSSSSTTTQAPTTPAAPATSSSVPTTQAPSNGGGGGAPSGDGATMLQLHNDFRAKYGAGPLTWNTELADFARNYASKCEFKHSGGPYGENLAAGSGSAYNVKSGFDAWANEASKYDWNNPGFAMGTGHFTQVVWKETTELGCAVIQCKANTILAGASKYVICEYRKPGNMVGNNGQYFRDNVGTRQG